MITLNQERGLVSVATWGDVTDLPGYTDGINPKTQKLVSIIGRYILADPVRCGLSSCRTPHGRGFVVTIDGGQVTNIGKDCGKKHFGVDFIEMSRAFERDDRNRQRRELLQTFQAQIPGLMEQIARLRVPLRGDEIYRACQTVRLKLPASARAALSKMVAVRDGRLMRDRLETQEEADIRELREFAHIRQAVGDEDADERKAKRISVSVQVGLIEGISIYNDEMDLRKLLIIDILPRIKTIQGLFLPDLGDRDLREHARWVAGIDEKLKRAEHAINEGRRFLKKSNLQQFKSILNDSKDVRELNRIVADVAIADDTSGPPA